MASIGTCAQANTAWNTRNRIDARISGPNTGCSTTASILSLNGDAVQPIAADGLKILRTSV